jgi:hypothetical protein
MQHMNSFHGCDSFINWPVAFGRPAQKKSQKISDGRPRHKFVIRS